MFCSECGEKLIVKDQKFCHNCGTETIVSSNTTGYKNERIQPKPKPEIIYVPIKKQAQLQKGAPGKYSNMCLGLGLGSIIIGIISFIIGASYFRSFYYPSYNFIPRLTVSIVMLLLRVGGLIMGIYSKFFSSKAVLLEPYNETEKTGIIFGILGIIANAIGLYMSFLGPFSFLHLTYL